MYLVNRERCFASSIQYSFYDRVESSKNKWLRKLYENWRKGDKLTGGEDSEKFLKKPVFFRKVLQKTGCGNFWDRDNGPEEKFVGDAVGNLADADQRFSELLGIDKVLVSKQAAVRDRDCLKDWISQSLSLAFSERQFSLGCTARKRLFTGYLTMLAIFASLYFMRNLRF